MRREKIARITGMGLAMTLCAVLLAGCGSVTYKDGTYEGRSEVYEGDEDGSGAGYGIVTITISGGVITDCVYRTYEPDGTLKDETYGMQDGEIANRDFYNKAQRAVQACGRYAESLVQTGDVREVDAISGATISYDEFTEAALSALAQARE